MSRYDVLSRYIDNVLSFQLSIYKLIDSLDESGEFRGIDQSSTIYSTRCEMLSNNARIIQNYADSIAPVILCSNARFRRCYRPAVLTRALIIPSVIEKLGSSCRYSFTLIYLRQFKLFTLQTTPVLTSRARLQNQITCLERNGGPLAKTLEKDQPN